MSLGPLFLIRQPNSAFLSLLFFSFLSLSFALSLTLVTKPSLYPTSVLVPICFMSAKKLLPQILFEKINYMSSETQKVCGINFIIVTCILGVALFINSSLSYNYIVISVNDIAVIMP